MKNQRGFTLLEIMIAVAMMAIVVAIASPDWQAFISNRRTTGASRELYNVLQHARMKAIKEGQSITVIYFDDKGDAVSGASDDAPQPFAAARISWDQNGDGTPATTEIFSTSNHVLCDTNQDSMAYTSRGILFGGNSGTLRVWNERTLRQYSIVINNLGAMRQAIGIHNASSSKASFWSGSQGGAGGGQP
ncbi:GspH/FimT family pseudopilin [Desulfoluna spongiiphila]|uniref:Type II secretion system protein H n=1 Tax=Desulfoluna spongiiphila TaxID=419481 RepID=A0A1G5AKM9_9BACT|nr:GspH/FimT family pseudopilin [Desulfoluna spongiiphila]SCX78447.1 prepilin-type N-terminal cleavage/methylation domain-containing protein [Desulfoluna spongiiphila]